MRHLFTHGFKLPGYLHFKLPIAYGNPVFDMWIYTKLSYCLQPYSKTCIKFITKNQLFKTRILN